MSNKTEEGGRKGKERDLKNNSLIFNYINLWPKQRPLISKTSDNGKEFIISQKWVNKCYKKLEWPEFARPGKNYTIQFNPKKLSSSILFFFILQTIQHFQFIMYLFILILCVLSVYLQVYMCTTCVPWRTRASDPLELGLQPWAALCKCSEPSLGRLQTQNVLLTMQSSIQSHVLFFF